MSAAGRVCVTRIVAGAWEENCYVASRGADAVVIDPGGKAEQILAQVESDGLRVHAVLATHGHHDHVGAAGAVSEACGAPFAIHGAESRGLGRVNFSRAAFHGLGPVRIPPIGIDLAAESELRFGALEVGVEHAPGHSPGSVCLAVGGILFVGDTLSAQGLGKTDLPEADADALAASVRALVLRHGPGARVLPGHGEPARLGATVAAGRELRPA